MVALNPLFIAICIISLDLLAGMKPQCLGVKGTKLGARLGAFAVSFGLFAFPDTLPVLAKVSDETSLSRFNSGYDELKNLDRDWDKIVLGNGDNIRRKLGTVYTPPKCESPLCSFEIFVNRFVKNNADEVDMDVFEEPARELLEALNQADYLAYSSIFSEYGNGGGGKDYIADSRTQVRRAMAKMEEVIGIINK
jgi:hypothetical protein